MFYYSSMQENGSVLLVPTGNQILFILLNPERETPISLHKASHDLSIPVSHIATMFNVSDTYCHECFMKYVDMKRLPLSEAISIDEVYLNIGKNQRYAMVIIDYISKEIIDILPNRFKKTTQEYFLSITYEERQKVKFLVCDMYKPYLNYSDRYFKNAITIVDSFHIVSLITRWVVSKITPLIYINNLVFQTFSIFFK